MGKPINIYQLIKSFLKENSLSENNFSDPQVINSIEIKTIGLRKGEKLHEELFYDDKYEKCDDMIFSENIDEKYSKIDLDKFEKELNDFINANSNIEVRQFLKTFANL